VSVIHARDNYRRSLVNVQFTQNDVEYVQHKLMADFNSEQIGERVSFDTNFVRVKLKLAGI
jgi:hypothetical protein